MKKEILVVLGEIVELLHLCNLEDKADWFRSKAQLVKSVKIGSEEFKSVLMEMRSIIVGMGSFSDLPMYPKKESGMSDDEARKKQWDLAERLGEVISKSLLDNRRTSGGKS